LRFDALHKADQYVVENTDVPLGKTGGLGQEQVRDFPEHLDAPFRRAVVSSAFKFRNERRRHSSHSWCSKGNSMAKIWQAVVQNESLKWLE
jgi:hypothetical protein